MRASPRATLFTAARSAEAAAPAPREPDRASIERFSALMLPHLDAAYSFARYLTRGGDHAEDVVHDAYARALNAFSDYRGGDAKAWLLTIVRNCCYSWHKSHRWDRSTVSFSDDAAKEVTDVTATDLTKFGLDSARETVIQHC